MEVKPGVNGRICDFNRRSEAAVQAVTIPVTVVKVAVQRTPEEEMPAVPFALNPVFPRIVVPVTAAAAVPPIAGGDAR